MMLNEVIVILALWLTFLWFCDPDGYRSQMKIAFVPFRLT